MSNKGGRNKLPSSTRTTSYAAAYQGPLPPAAHLEHYERILPGAADRIVSAFEKQVEHRHRMEERYSKSACSNSSLGLWAGFLICLVTIIASTLLIFLGKTVGGTVLGSVSITSLASVFVYGSKVKKH
jgi:uncharacterized membrane protein